MVIIEYMKTVALNQILMESFHWGPNFKCGCEMKSLIGIMPLFCTITPSESAHIHGYPSSNEENYRVYN